MHKNNFDLVRLLAALQVFLLHGRYYFELPSNYFFKFIGLIPGVACFFVVSGYLVMKSALSSKNIKSYFFKRGLRVYPGLWINILIIELSIFVAGNFDKSIELFQYLLFAPIYFLSASSYLSLGLTQGPDRWLESGFFNFFPSGVLWTLTVELSFYLVLPFVAFVFRKSKVFASIFVLILSFLSRYFSVAVTEKTLEFGSFSKIAPETVVPYFWIFSIGVLFCFWEKELKNFFKGRWVIWLLIYFGFSLFLVHFTKQKYFLQFKY